MKQSLVDKLCIHSQCLLRCPLPGILCNLVLTFRNELCARCLGLRVPVAARALRRRTGDHFLQERATRCNGTIRTQTHSQCHSSHSRPPSSLTCQVAQLGLPRHERHRPLAHRRSLRSSLLNLYAYMSADVDSSPVGGVACGQLVVPVPSLTRCLCRSRQAPG